MTRLLACLATLALLVAYSRPSPACGFVSARWAHPTEMPSPAQEDVLIVYDDDERREHFIRRVRFRKADSDFAFIVPTPTRPKVAEAKDEIWSSLRKDCPHRFSAPSGPLGTGSGFGRGGLGLIGRGGGVQVLEEKKLGDFTSFVLAATDTDAFDAWLKEHGFGPTEKGREWLDAYVQRAFFYVALRYDGEGKNEKPAAGKTPSAAANQLLSKTVRITFDTPVPFYPYREPADTADDASRKLLVWFIGGSRRVPIAGVDVEGKRLLRRPWSEAEPCAQSARSALNEVLDAEVLSSISKKAKVQTFADVKTTRKGWDDVLLTPIEPEDCDPKCLQERARFAAMLAPRAVNAKGPPQPFTKPEPPTKTPPPESTPPNRPASGCAIGKAPSSATAWWLLGGILLYRRRSGSKTRRRSSLALLAALLPSCDSQGPAPAPSASVALPPPSASPPPKNTAPALPLELPVDPEGARSTAFSVLTGRGSDRFVPVWSRPGPGGIGAIERWRSAPMPSRKDLQAACVPDDRVEGVVTYELKFDGDQVSEATVQSALPKPIRDCVRAHLERTTWKDRDLFSEVTGAYGFGKTGKEVSPHRRRVHATPWSGRPGSLGSPVRIRTGKIDVNGKLPPEVIRRIVRQNYGRFRLCYERGLSNDPKLEGGVTIAFVIGREGRVTAVRDAGSQLADATVVRCISQTFHQLTFPKPEDGKPITVKFPVRLTVTDTAKPSED